MLADRIYETIDFLNEIDNMELDLRNKLSEMDNRTQDIMHYLENNKLKAYEHTKLSMELKRVRQERRKIKNDMAIINEYKKNCMQLQSQKGREALKNIIKRQEKVNNGKFRNRVYKDNELDLIIKKGE